MTIILGISSNDFLQEFNDLNRVIYWQQASGTQSNITGDNVYNYTGSTAISGIFLKREQSFELAKMGIFERGEAYIILPATGSIYTRDRFIIDGETYEVTPEDKIIIRNLANVELFKYATMRKYTGIQV